MHIAAFKLVKENVIPALESFHKTLIAKEKDIDVFLKSYLMSKEDK